MSLLLLVAALLAGAEPSPAPPPHPRPSIITKPDWAQLPSGEAMTRVYPARAAREEVEGRVLLQCIVTASGTLDRCRVLEETPADYGFGQAALLLTPEFRMRPQTVGGRPVDGASVRIPIVFNAPDESAAPPFPTLEEAARCYVLMSDRYAADPADADAGAQRGLYWVMVQARALEQNLSRDALDARVAAARKEVDQGHLTNDPCDF